MIAKSVLAAGIALGLLVTSAQSQTTSGGAGAWSERVQIVYDPATRAISREKIRVWDFEPGKTLEFVWEPGAGATVAPDGRVNGSGKLVWRVKGSASYDNRTIYSTYVGAMRDGMPDGAGRLEFRSGEFFEGNFSRGALTGQGVHMDASGNRYDGEFRDGLENGMGTLASISGDIYSGAFLDGKKHGVGETRLAGGTFYTSMWTAGVESGRPTVFADATLGGLLKAQSGGGDAGKVEITVGTEPRMNRQADEDMGVAYQHKVGDDIIAIYPLDKDLNALWNGTAPVNGFATSVFHDRDWEYSPAFVEVGVKTTDGSRVKIAKLGMEVASSEAYRKPMLGITAHSGCVGFRPSFSITNDGWGAVKDMKMTLAFAGEGDDAPTSRAFTKEIGSFDMGTDVVIEDVLQDAGVNTKALAKKRFSCPNEESLPVCQSQVRNAGLGEIADFIYGRDAIYTNVKGTLDYSWADDAGTVYAASEPFDTVIAVAFIEGLTTAECGDGFGSSPEAMRYQDVRLPIGKKDYVVDMPIRGNKTISSYSARLKMQSEPAMSSFHQLTVAATFADGSVRRSKPVSFFFMKPRLSTFQSKVKPATACYIPDGIFNC